MAKKKTTVDYLSGYIPAGFSPTVSQSNVNIIPPYDDRGVSFKVYSKTLRGDGSYELNPQIRRLQNARIGGAVTTSTSGTRIDTKKSFYCAGIHVGFKSTNPQIFVSMYDGSSAASTLKFDFLIFAGQNQFFIDFSNSPREFLSPNLFMNLSGALGGVDDFVEVIMIGWAE